MTAPVPAKVDVGDVGKGGALIEDVSKDGLAEASIQTASTATPSLDGSSGTRSPESVQDPGQPPPPAPVLEPVEITAVDDKRALCGHVQPMLYFAPSDDVTNYYQFGDVLGRGNDAIVFKAERMQPSATEEPAAAAPTVAEPPADGAAELSAAPTSAEDISLAQLPTAAVAVKVLQKKRLMLRGQRKLRKLRAELGLWQKLHHPNLLELLHVIELDEAVCVLCQLAQCELFDRLAVVDRFNEGECKLVVAQIAAGLSHLHHEFSVTHRDVKSANILVLNKNVCEYGCVKLADFGFAARFERLDEACFEDNCGTLEYYAPELCENMLARLRDEPSVWYSAAVDCWAFGCVLYECLAGAPPYWSEDDVDQVHLILRARLDFPDEHFANVSDEAKSLIRALIHPDPKRRATMAQAIEHPWFSNERSKGSESDDGSVSRDPTPVERRLYPVETSSEGEHLASRQELRKGRRTTEYMEIWKMRGSFGASPVAFREQSPSFRRMDTSPMDLRAYADDVSALTHTEHAAAELEGLPLKAEVNRTAGGCYVRDRRGRRSKESFTSILEAGEVEEEAWKGRHARKPSSELLADVKAALARWDAMTSS